MRSLVYYVAVSIDGFIATRDGDFSAFLAEGDHLAAIVGDFGDALPGPAREALGVTGPPTRFGTVLMGWNTYAVGLPFGMADPYPHLRTIVFTRDPAARRAEVNAAAPGTTDAAGRVEFTADDPVETIRQLKREPSEPAERTEPSELAIWLCGGGRLAGEVIDEIDSLVLKVNPIVLGDGIRLFGAADARSEAPSAPAVRAFTLESSTAYDSGVVIDRYRR